ncbi:MAG: PEP-CTERM sorting domain-containing protein [Planctomycetota bacterium]|nr:PEP-CTERM sorting domain-containing protein [Planctomycetota bacterium]
MKSFLALMLVLCVGFVANAESHPRPDGLDEAFGPNSVEAFYYAETGELIISTSPSSGTGAINFYVESSAANQTPLPTAQGDDAMLPGFGNLPQASQDAINARLELGVTVGLSNNANRRGVAGLGKTQNFSLGSIGAGLPMETLSLFFQKAVGGGDNSVTAPFSTAEGSQARYIGAVVPEPASLGLVGLGVAGLLAARRRS